MTEESSNLKKGNSEFLTPVHPVKRSRIAAASSARNSPAATVDIPASPFMKKLGWGTGVSVYLLERFVVHRGVATGGGGGGGSRAPHKFSVPPHTQKKNHAYF